jgi:hypothetical protein
VWKRRFDEVIPDRDFLEGRVENVANLGLFVLRRTLMLQAEAATRSPQHSDRDQSKSGLGSAEFDPLTSLQIRSRPGRTACHGAKAHICLGLALVVKARGRDAATRWQGKG